MQNTKPITGIFTKLINIGETETDLRNSVLALIAQDLRRHPTNRTLIIRFKYSDNSDGLLHAKPIIKFGDLSEEEQTDAFKYSDELTNIMVSPTTEGGTLIIPISDLLTISLQG